MFRVIILCFFGFFIIACENDPIAESAVAAEEGYADVPTNLNVGMPAPAFTLPDHRGEPVSLAELRAQNNVLLVFFRGKWCPFCVGHFDDLEAVFPKLEQYDTRLLAISPEDSAESAKMADKFEVPYTFLTDTELAVTDMYGIRNAQDLPHPAVILIDKRGNVLWYYVSENYRQRPSSSQVLAVLERQLGGA